jgi:hypothetical protein
MSNLNKKPLFIFANNKNSYFKFERKLSDERVIAKNVLQVKISRHWERKKCDKQNSTEFNLKIPRF